VSAFQVELRPAAVRQLKKINKTDRLRLLGAIALLGKDPRPPSSRQLRGRPGWRVRVGDYRIFYTIDDGKVLVVVVAVGHRREIYE
jgi:mRNA interferase RelE/StbE